MEGSKEAELVMAVLMYAVRCLLEGDLAALRDMNFGPKEIDALREMKLGDLCRVESMRAHCLAIGLNRDVYWPMLANLREQRESEELQHALIRADAPQEMLQALFGMRPREYTRLRHSLVATGGVGRPREPDDAGAERLWHAWKSIDRATDAPLDAQHYLTLHAKTGISLRTIWRQVQRWVAYGGLDANG
jgi:Protein of unknown function (DUF2857)